jgi:MFS family permease
LGESARAFRDVFRNANLRRVELALAGSIVGEWSYAVAISVYAYERGGAAAVGLVGLIRMLPAAAAAPFAAVLGDRFRRERVMVASDLIRLLALGAAAAAVVADATPALVYALTAVVSIASRAFRPAQAALLPSLAVTAEELTAANVVSSTIESLGIFAGPALGGILLAATSTGVVLGAAAGTFAWSAFFVARIRTGLRQEPLPAVGGLAQEALAGFATIARDSRLRLLIGLFAAQTLVAGALNVLIVVSALRLLDLGQSGVGFLNSAIGVGGLVGALVALALVGRRRLAADFGLGILLWGIPLTLIGIWPHAAAALVLLGIVGVGNTIVDVAGLTLLQRTVPDEVLARVMGVVESVFIGNIGIGAILAPLAIAAFGIRGALMVAGALLPVLAGLTWRRLADLDAHARVPERELELLRGIPMFAPLPPATLERLASSLARVELSAGSVLFRQGDSGDRFYVVGSGQVEVEIDGRRANVLGPGDHFGEIALLRDVPRTATIRALTDAQLHALERDEFIAAVTGHALSAEAADAVIATRLGSLRPGVASV